MLSIVLVLTAMLPTATFPTATRITVEVAEPKLPPASPDIVAEAQVLVAIAKTATDAAERDRLLARAQNRLEAYLKNGPTNDDGDYAQVQLIVVHLAVGNAALDDARATRPPAERATFIAKARERFQRAESLGPQARDAVASRINHRHGHIFTNDERIIRKREAVKGWLIRSVLIQAEAAEGLAATFPPGSREAREHYSTAAERYGLVYKDYRTLVAGLVARAKQGECRYLAGDARGARELYSDVLNGPDEFKPVHELRVCAMALSLECRNSQQEKAHAAAFSQGEEYLAHLLPEEESWRSWQAVRYETARGYLLAAKAATNESQPNQLSPNQLRPNSAGSSLMTVARRTVWLAKARGHAEKLTARSGSYRGAAEALGSEIVRLRDVGGNSTKNGNVIKNNNADGDGTN